MSEVNNQFWIQEYITKVPPIVMSDPFLEILGQIEGSIPYSYGDIVKFSGHSCVTVAGAWAITRKALETLYPNETPVRGQIRITPPGAENEGVIGVMGEVMSFITGAASKAGFPGAGFGKAYNRRGLMQYSEKFMNVHPVNAVWVFERFDTGAKVGVRYDSSKVQPYAKREHGDLMPKIGERKATPEETKEWVEAWNTRARFVLENADNVPGMIIVEKL